MNLIELVKKSIENSRNQISKINQKCLDVNGMTSPKVKHLLNNLLSEGGNYLEIGVYHGSMFISAVYGNNAKNAIAIDNWSEFEGQRKIFESNCMKVLGYKPIIIEEDCYTIDNSQIKDIEIFLFDGHHTEEQQYEALRYYYDSLKDTFIFVVDDYSDRPVSSGTQKSIQDLKLSVLYDEFLPEGDYWRGVYVAVLQKQQNNNEV